MTEKIVRLRPIEHDDLKFLRDLSNEPEIRSHVVGWDWPASLANQERWFASGPDSNSTRRFIVESETGARIGLTGLWEIDLHNRTAVTGLKLGGPGDARGKGYGTLALNAIMEFAFLDVGLHRLHSTILASNEASLGLYVTRCHWAREGTLRQHVWRNGKHVDVIQIGILAKEYAESKH